jgi:hypothetical protein
LSGLGVEDVERFYHEALAGSYTGRGFRPKEEICLLAEGRSRGLLPQLRAGDRDPLARRVSLGLGLRTRPMLTFVDASGDTVSGRIGRRRAFVAWLKWYLPWRW